MDKTIRECALYVGLHEVLAVSEILGLYVSASNT